MGPRSRIPSMSKNNMIRKTLLAAVLLFTSVAFTQNRGTTASDAELRQQRNAIEAELQSIAVVERKVMVTMRDGKRMQADIYRPKDNDKYPIIFSRTPYNFNWWDMRLGAPRDMTTVLDAVKRGYCVRDHERTRAFFSEGNYDILGPPIDRWRGRDQMDDVANSGRTARSVRSDVRRQPSGRWPSRAQNIPALRR